MRLNHRYVCLISDNKIYLNIKNRNIKTAKHVKLTFLNCVQTIKYCINTLIVFQSPTI